MKNSRSCIVYVSCIHFCSQWLGFGRQSVMPATMNAITNWWLGSLARASAQIGSRADCQHFYGRPKTTARPANLQHRTKPLSYSPHLASHLPRRTTEASAARCRVRLNLQKGAGYWYTLVNLSPCAGRSAWSCGCRRRNDAMDRATGGAQGTRPTAPDTPDRLPGLT